MATLPHFRHPFTVTAGRVAVVEQDSEREIDQCIEAVLRTEAGSRIEQPEFGVPDETFDQLPAELNASVYVDAVEEWEPRAVVRGRAAVEELTKEVIIESERTA